MQAAPANSGSTSGSPPSNETKKKGKKRVRAFTADERAAHRVIEKQRREALNENFLDLARLIPALAPARRLSKSLIVHEGIDYLQEQRKMCIAAANEIQALLAENVELVNEVNTWRERSGVPGIGPRQIKPVGEALLALLKVDQEVLGTFPGGFGDNGIGEEQEDDGAEKGQEQPPVKSSLRPQAETFQSSDTIATLPPDSSIQPLQGQYILPPDAELPDGFVAMDGHFTSKEMMLSGDELFASFNNGYMEGATPLLQSPFAEFNPNDPVYQGFNIPTPEMGFYLAPGTNMSHFGHPQTQDS